jgi:uncharacterized membrane protein
MIPLHISAAVLALLLGAVGVGRSGGAGRRFLVLDRLFVDPLALGLDADLARLRDLVHPPRQRRAHRGFMIGTFLGLAGAGLGALAPGRMLYAFLFA